MSTDINTNNNAINIGLSGEKFDDILFCTGHPSIGLNKFCFSKDDYYEYSDTFEYNIGKDISEYLNEDIQYIEIYKNDL